MDSRCQGEQQTYGDEDDPHPPGRGRFVRAGLSKPKDCQEGTEDDQGDDQRGDGGRCCSDAEASGEKCFPLPETDPACLLRESGVLGRECCVDRIDRQEGESRDGQR